MPRIDRSIYDYECDFPGCGRKEQSSWANPPKDWWEIRVGVQRGANNETLGVVACGHEHARAVARTRFEEVLSIMFAGRGVTP